MTIKIETKIIKEYDDLEELMRKHNFIGYESGCERYMLVTSGSSMGSTVRPTGTWASRESQSRATTGYKVFENSTDLFEWMKG